MAYTTACTTVQAVIIAIIVSIKYLSVHICSALSLVDSPNALSVLVLCGLKRFLLA